VTTPTRRVDGLAVYERAGEPDAVRIVFVHGSMDRAASFLKVQRRLEGVTAVRYDRRGYGRSVEAGLAPDIDSQVADLRAVVGEEPAVVVGHSLGGVLALALAGQPPALVRAVVAFEAPMPWQPWWPSMSAGNQALTLAAEPADAAEAFMRAMIGDQLWERLPPSTRAERRAEGAALLRDLSSMRDRAVAPYSASAIHVPVIAGRGSTSAPHHRRAAEELTRLVAGATLVEIEGAGHGAHASHPDAFAQIVRDALTLAEVHTS
jgi:pimeloyl-ACP methyl ester carboxylesterase